MGFGGGASDVCWTGSCKRTASLRGGGGAYAHAVQSKAYIRSEAYAVECIKWLFGGLLGDRE